MGLLLRTTSQCSSAVVSVDRVAWRAAITEKDAGQPLCQPAGKNAADAVVEETVLP